MAYSKEYDSFKTSDGNEIYLYQAVSEGKWNNLYERYPIFCPECGIAPLKFTAKTSNHCAFLSSMPVPPNPEHSKDCSHRYKTIGKRAAKAFYDECTYAQAIDKLKACISLMHRRALVINGNSKEGTSKSFNILAKRTVNGHEDVRRLRTRSFYSLYQLDEDDIGFPIIFYGKVFLSVEEVVAKSGDRKFNVIKVRSIHKDKKVLQSIYFGNNTINSVEKDHQYLFAMVGVPERVGNYIDVWFYNRNYSLYFIDEPDNS